MTLHPTRAQDAADAIKRRRNIVADLRLVAELIEDGLPVPISIRPGTGEHLEVQVRAADTAPWLTLLGRPAAPWWPTIEGDGEHLEVTGRYLGSPITLIAFRRAVTEVCS